MMIKTILADSWDFGDATACIVKLASGNRLLGGDRESLIKRAGAQLAHQFQQLDWEDGLLPVHTIAMGAQERYGPNRNGDGFKMAALEKYHPLFVKHARCYRNHQNRQDSPFYGLIKASYYNPDMARVELLVGYFTNEKTAEKYGGRVADREIERLERGQDLSGSMACKIAFDVCASCGNKARNRGEYCDEASCVGPHGEKRGGCKNHLAKVADDGFINHVDNPHPWFFDWSSVGTPADRIAHGNQASYLLEKAAAADTVITSSELAEFFGVTAPPDLYVPLGVEPWVEQQRKLAFQLAEAEQQLEASRPSLAADDLCRAVDPAMQPPADLAGLAGTKLATGLAALADRQVVLPLRDFLRLELGGDEEKIASSVERVAPALPGIYGRLIADEDLDRQIRSSPYQPTSAPVPLAQRRWAEKLADYALSREAAQRRIWRSRIHDTPIHILPQPTTKSASLADPSIQQLAKRYALYKLAFLAAQAEHLPLTEALLLRQNYVSGCAAS